MPSDNLILAVLPSTTTSTPPPLFSGFPRKSVLILGRIRNSYLTLSHCCGHRCPLGVSVSECVIIDAACAAARGPHDVYRSLWVDINPFTPRRVPPRLPLHFHTYTFVGDATALMSTHTLHRAQPHTARRAAVDRLRRLAAGHRALPAHTRPRPLVLRALPRRRARRRRPRRAAAAAAVLLMPCAAGSLSE